MADPTLTILVIDDDPVDAELLSRYLEEIPGREIKLVLEDDGDNGLAALQARPEIDIVFVDYLLGARTGLDVLKGLKAAGVRQPVIMMTGQGNELVAVEAMKAGASDYLVKGQINPDDLHRALLNALEKAALHQKIEEQRRELERLARTDGLTGVFNRRHFMELFQQGLRASEASGAPLSLLMLDLDHFKKVNDTWGHVAGDEVLVRAAELIRDFARADGVPGRFGGEEFCVALPGVPRDAAARLAEDLRQAIASQTFRSPSGDEFRVTCSIGVAERASGDGAGAVGSLIHNADEALYRAKSEGRDRVRLG